jgi:hypothetical protein
MLFGGTELVEFTLTEELNRTVAVITANLESMKAGAH